ncbi:MAG TPA: rod shape-determining protein RodA [Thermodesulfobacteriota bacterium]|nr:rod shape-determining protein RodA [Thermodesulfobacteriota bacterium]
MINFRLLKNFDVPLFFITIIICAIGIINLYSATINIGTAIFKKQIFWVSLGLIITVILSLFDYRMIQRYSNHFYLINILLLVIVIIFGREVSGARSWLSLGGAVNIQPSELTKLAVIFVLAKFYHDDFYEGLYSVSELVKPFLMAVIPIVLIALQPDMGTAFIVTLIALSIILFAGVKTKHIILLTICGSLLFVPLWGYILKDYQKTRIKAFLDPSLDPLGSGYHATQSKIAIGSGKLSGKGFTQGTQTQLRFLPEQHTDFAFSVIAEEWGFLGSIFTILLFLILILWILDTSSRSKDKFSMYVCFGIASMFFWHTFINIGMVIGIFPVTGLPLLFISYGGSASLTSLIAIGIVMGIRMRKSRVSEQDFSFND